MYYQIFKLTNGVKVIKVASIKNLGESKIEQLIKQVLAMNPIDLETGVHEIVGKDFCINRMSGDTVLVSDSLPEVHKDYLDVHLVLDGYEMIGYSIEPEDKEFINELKFENDIEFISDIDYEQFVTLDVGQYVVIPAEHWHRPMSTTFEPNHVEKVVIKIKTSYL